METKNIYDKLSAIQLQLRVGKDLRNDFGGYNYRSAEQILAHLRAPVAAERCALTLTDELIEKCGRTYIKATATLVNCEDPSQVVSKDAYAAENIGKKGSDPAQVTGAASSYAASMRWAACFRLMMAARTLTPRTSTDVMLPSALIAVSPSRLIPSVTVSRCLPLTLPASPSATPTATSAAPAGGR